MRALVADDYGLFSSERGGFVERIIEFTIHDTADEADLSYAPANEHASSCGTGAGSS